MSNNIVEPEKTQMTIRGLVAYWISKAIRAQAHASTTSTHACTHTRTRIYPWAPNTEVYRDLLLSHGSNGFITAPQCYVTRTLPFLLIQLFEMYKRKTFCCRRREYKDFLYMLVVVQDKDLRDLSVVNPVFGYPVCMLATLIYDSTYLYTNT
jgi:hypothetical protein